MRIYSKKHFVNEFRVSKEFNIKKIDQIIFQNNHIKKKFINKKYKHEIPENDYDLLTDIEKQEYRIVLIMNKEFKKTNDLINKKLLTPKINQIKDKIFIYGGVKGKSYIDNINDSSKHLYRCTIDIKSFFPSTSYKKIFNYFIDNYERDIASILSYYCCFNSDNKIVLAQGFHTSTNIAYLVNKNMFEEIINLVEEFNVGREKIRFSIYVDDILISSKNKIPQKLVDKIIKIIYRNGYEINTKKISLGIMRPIHGVVKYSASKTSFDKNRKNTKLKFLYDKLIIYIKNNENISIDEYKNLIIPLISKYNGLYNNLKNLDVKLLKQYHIKFYEEVTSVIKLRYKFIDRSSNTIIILSKDSEVQKSYKLFKNI